ncbi:zinc ribbon domain-containing protein [Streptomyces mirabilis]|uniref:zinc ribbon domain-containing protein n=1 Tax=Streptomyces mirabilis TaxID=68239 RepID=UPI00365276BB
MTTTLTASPVGHRAAVDLAAVREQWGDLLDAIGRRPAAEWPPREARGFLDQLAAGDRTEDDPMPAAPVIGRVPLTIREHPAPLNLDALDAALAVERDLFDLADQVAERVQRSVRRTPVALRSIPPRTVMREDLADRQNPGRWNYQAPASPGSREYGLHWAAVWLEGRALGEKFGDLFTPMSARLLDHVAATAARARRAVERALGRDGRTTTLDEPCPWCGGSLTGRTRPGGEPVVTCSTGAACTTPAKDGRQRGQWQGADLVALWIALAAERQQPAA